MGPVFPAPLQRRGLRLVIPTSILVYGYVKKKHNQTLIMLRTNFVCFLWIVGGRRDTQTKRRGGGGCCSYSVRVSDGTRQTFKIPTDHRLEPFSAPDPTFSCRSKYWYFSRSISIPRTPGLWMSKKESGVYTIPLASGLWTGIKKESNMSHDPANSGIVDGKK